VCVVERNRLVMPRQAFRARPQRTIPADEAHRTPAHAVRRSAKAVPRAPIGAVGGCLLDGRKRYQNPGDRLCKKHGSPQSRVPVCVCVLPREQQLRCCSFIVVPLPSFFFVFRFSSNVPNIFSYAEQLKPNSSDITIGLKNIFKPNCRIYIFVQSPRPALSWLCRFCKMIRFLSFLSSKRKPLSSPAAHQSPTVSSFVWCSAVLQIESPKATSNMEAILDQVQKCCVTRRVRIEEFMKTFDKNRIKKVRGIRICAILFRCTTCIPRASICGGQGRKPGRC
jgi:hypothetical protein